MHLFYCETPNETAESRERWKTRKIDRGGKNCWMLKALLLVPQGTAGAATGTRHMVDLAHHE